MNKAVDKPVQIGEKRSRHGFRLYGDPSSVEAGDREKALIGLLQALVDAPALLRCGPGMPEKMALHHDGSRWVLIAEAEQDDA